MQLIFLVKGTPNFTNQLSSAVLNLEKWPIDKSFYFNKYIIKV